MLQFRFEPLQQRSQRFARQMDAENPLLAGAWDSAIRAHLEWKIRQVRNVLEDLIPAYRRAVDLTDPPTTG